MSFYLGSKSSDGTKLLHITSGSNTELEMRGAPIATTVFHTDFLLLASRTFNYTPYIHYNAGNNCTYIYMRADDFLEDVVLFLKRVTGSSYRVFEPQLPYARVGEITYMKEYNDLPFNEWGKFTSEADIEYHNSANVPFDSNAMLGSNVAEGGNLASVFRWFAFKNTIPDDLEIVGLNVGKLGEVANLNLSQTDILIDKNNFNVRGIELDKLTYLSRTVLNSTDKVIDFNSGVTMQLINSELGGAPSFELRTNDGTQIFNNDKKIFDSKFNGFMRRLGSVTRLIPANEETTFIATVPAGALMVAELLTDYGSGTYTHHASTHAIQHTARVGPIGPIIANGIWWGDEFDPTYALDFEYLEGFQNGVNIDIYRTTSWNYEHPQKMYFAWFGDESQS